MVDLSTCADETSAYDRDVRGCIVVRSAWVDGLNALLEDMSTRILGTRAWALDPSDWDGETRSLLDVTRARVVDWRACTDDMSARVLEKRACTAVARTWAGETSAHLPDTTACVGVTTAHIGLMSAWVEGDEARVIVASALVVGELRFAPLRWRVQLRLSSRSARGSANNSLSARIVGFAKESHRRPNRRKGFRQN